VLPAQLARPCDLESSLGPLVGLHLWHLCSTFLLARAITLAPYATTNPRACLFDSNTLGLTTSAPVKTDQPAKLSTYHTYLLHDTRLLHDTSPLHEQIAKTSDKRKVGPSRAKRSHDDHRYLGTPAQAPRSRHPS
jgi:hypothetical protein